MRGRVARSHDRDLQQQQALAEVPMETISSSSIELRRRPRHDTLDHPANPADGGSHPTPLSPNDSDEVLGREGRDLHPVVLLAVGELVLQLGEVVWHSYVQAGVAVAGGVT